MNYDQFIVDIGAVVMGRTTYEWIRDHIESSGEKWSYDMPAWVVTHAAPAGHARRRHPLRAGLRHTNPRRARGSCLRQGRVGRG